MQLPQRTLFSMIDPLADALAALGIEEASMALELRKMKDRNEILTFLKEQAGVSKMGQRMKLVALVLNDEAQPAAAVKTPDAQPESIQASTQPRTQMTSRPPLASPVPQQQLPQTHPSNIQIPASTSMQASTSSNIPGLTTPTTTGRTWWEVLPQAVKMRSAPSLDAEVIGFKKQRAVLEVEAEQGGWVLLKERVEPGTRAQWALIDGSVLGLGPLLKRVPASARWRDEDEQLEARVSDLQVDNWLDDM